MNPAARYDRDAGPVRLDGVPPRRGGDGSPSGAPPLPGDSYQPSQGPAAPDALYGIVAGFLTPQGVLKRKYETTPMTLAEFTRSERHLLDRALGQLFGDGPGTLKERRIALHALYGSSTMGIEEYHMLNRKLYRAEARHILDTLGEKAYGDSLRELRTLYETSEMPVGVFEEAERIVFSTEKQRLLGTDRDKPYRDRIVALRALYDQTSMPRREFWQHEHELAVQEVDRIRGLTLPAHEKADLVTQLFAQSSLTEDECLEALRTMGIDPPR